MKKVFVFVLGLLLSLILLYACKKNVQSSSNPDQSGIMSTSSSITLIGAISNGVAQPLLNIDSLKSSLITNGSFDDIEEIGLEYGSINNNQEAYFTIIGKKGIDAISFQAELIIQGQNIYIEDPGNNVPQTMAKHTCTGAPCSSCKFIRGGGWLGLGITGCACNGDGGECNHSITSDNSWLITVASAILGML